MHCYARSPELEKERIRKGLLGALRYGKPFVLDMMHLPIEEDTIRPLFDDIQAGLYDKLMSKKIYREEHYSQLIIEDEDGLEYLVLGRFRNGERDKKGFDATRWVSLSEIVEELDVSEDGEVDMLFHNFEATVSAIRGDAFRAERERRAAMEEGSDDADS